MLRDGELETAAEAARSLGERAVRPTELVERSLARAEAWHRATNAFRELWGQEALEAARAIEREGTREAPAAPDAPGEGMPIPLAVKDLFDVRGRETTGCCRAYRGNVAASDAEVIARVRESGIVMIGKTNQHELAAGGTNLVSACGRTGNPWDPDRITGGSSGGSGAAVAAGVVPWALGSDTGGSIRIPAALCGTFGLKPTWGRLPLGGVMPLAPSMDCPGPMASTVSDLRILLQILDGRPVDVVDTQPPEPQAAGLAVGVPGEGFFTDRVHMEVRAVVEAVATTLEGAGVAVRPVDGEGIREARRVWLRVCTPEFAAAHPSLADRRDEIAPSVLEWLDMGAGLSPAEREEAQSRQRAIAAWFRTRLAHVDALLIPTTPYPAPRTDEREIDLGDGRMVDLEHVGPGWLTSSVNLTGIPAINLPAGRSTQGMPIGVSLVGHANGEDRLLDLAALWEAADAYRPQRPSLPS